MPAPVGPVAGYAAKLYYVATKLATKTTSTISAAAVEANEVVGANGTISFSKSRDVYDLESFGNELVGKLPGAINPDPVTFTVNIQLDNAVHKALRDDNAQVEHSFILAITKGSGITYAVVDGYVSDATVNNPFGGVDTMDISIAPTAQVVYVDSA